jgi:hypothetical protein
MQATWTRGLRRSHDLGMHAQALQRSVGIGYQPVAADLVAREPLLVDEHHGQALPRQHGGAGAAGRAGTHHEDVAVLGQVETSVGMAYAVAAHRSIPAAARR